MIPFDMWMRLSRPIQQPDADDLIVWPDGTWCFRRELGQYSHMSDDYVVAFVDTDAYREFFS